jgi:polyisoprenyl-teichoic acid--peptidoglycan teichoic acid transferase
MSRAGLADDHVEPADIDTLTVIAGGLDSRLPGEPENADVFIIARVDLVEARLRAVSVPRDLYVEIPGFGYDKITRSYDHGSKADGGSFKGGSNAMKGTVLANFGIEVDAVAVTTFDGFEQIVDALGGIDIMNPYDLYDPEFPTIDYGIEEIFFPVGPLHLDGEAALKYVRTRHQDGDLARVERQQRVLLAMLDKATTPAFVERLPDLAHAFRRVVRNDIGQSRRLALALAAPRFNAESVEFTTLDAFVASDYTAQGMWIYSGDWGQIPGYVQSFLAGASI